MTTPPDTHTPPVLLLTFNRPHLTTQALDRVRLARPRQLFWACDGPRPGYPGDVALVAAVRALVTTIDWECELQTRFLEDNLGCGLGPAAAITWFFEHVAEGIILEDDCIPDPSFFPFCFELLERYRHDERIMLVSGDYSLGHWRASTDSYYFSHYAETWGWATWRRAWRLYDHSASRWPAVRLGGTLAGSLTGPERRYWIPIFDRVYRQPRDFWDYQWLLTCLSHGGLSVTPWVNLVTNIGFGADATHTHDDALKLPSQPMSFPLAHPTAVARNAEADARLFDAIFARSLATRILDRLGRLTAWAYRRLNRTP